MTVVEKDPTRTKDPVLVDVSCDPITRIVGSLGIFTKIDFANRVVADCRSTSSIFRGYSIFMKGKDPRDAHFITSRICDFCEQMVKETTPSVLARAENTPAPHAADHGYRTIAEIMRALNPFTGEFY